MNCLNCGRSLIILEGTEIYLACPCSIRPLPKPYARETIRRIMPEPNGEEPTMQPMEWLRELDPLDYARCCDRFKAFPICVEQVERRDALRMAFWWGHVDSDSYIYFQSLNRKWKTMGQTST